jgi:pyoverdine/dityrosine biosynthesis protein Dit1
MNAIQAYKHYYIDRDHEQVDLFRLLKNEYGIEKIIYPGSYIHISPSFIFSDVVYIDSDKNAKMYFQSNDLIHLVNTKK